MKSRFQYKFYENTLTLNRVYRKNVSCICKVKLASYTNSEDGLELFCYAVFKIQAILKAFAVLERRFIYNAVKTCKSSENNSTK